MASSASSSVVRTEGVSDQIDVARRRVPANGISFEVIEAGAGPLVLMLHGFPDTAESWEHQWPALVDAGYRVAAPYLRGYAPTDAPAPGNYMRHDLAADIAGLADALAGDEPVYLIGQDWGASISYEALTRYPEKFRRAIVMAIPHTDKIVESFSDPEQIARAFHWWFFQLPVLPEKFVSANDYAFIDYLWREWSPESYDEAHVRRVKECLKQPGALQAAISYYRENGSAAFENKPRPPITTPTLALCGDLDIRSRVMRSQADCFAGEYEYAEIEGCGHFLHRERPEEINKRILDWFALG